MLYKGEPLHGSLPEQLLPVVHREDLTTHILQEGRAASILSTTDCSHTTTAEDSEADLILSTH